MLEVVSSVVSYMVGIIVLQFRYAFGTFCNLVKGRKIKSISSIVCAISSFALITGTLINAIILIVSFAMNDGYSGAFTWDRVNNTVGNSREVWQSEPFGYIFLILLAIAFVAAMVLFFKETGVLDWLLLIFLSGTSVLMSYGSFLSMKLNSIAHEGTMIYPEQQAKLDKRGIKLPVGYKTYLMLEAKLGEDLLRAIILIVLLASVIMLIRFLMVRFNDCPFSLAGPALKCSFANILWLFMILPLIVFMVENPFAGIVLVIGLIVIGIILKIDPSDFCFDGANNNDDSRPKNVKSSKNKVNDNSAKKAKLQKELNDSRHALSEHRRGSMGYFGVDEKAMGRKIENLEREISKL